MAKDVSEVFEGDGVVNFPSRYWVSVQLTQEQGLYGGLSMDLRPFTGYELELKPIAWPMQTIVERLVGTISYLFDVGPVLKDGDTLGINHGETIIFKAKALRSGSIIYLDGGT
jgi:hypothetical protein